MELPKKDGRQVLTEIRSDAELESIPVVVLTASAVHRAISRDTRSRALLALSMACWSELVAVSGTVALKGALLDRKGEQ